MRTNAQPAATRLDVLDAIRGFALCGILLINLPHMGWLMNSDEPVRAVRDGGFSTTLWWVQMLLVNGNMRGLFSLLFGASMLLFLAKAERGSATRAEANRLMLRRLFWLFMFGVLDMTLLLWPGDILNIYAIAGLIVLPFATARPRMLVIGALIAIAGVSTYMAAHQLPKRDIIAQGPALEAQAAAGQALSSDDKKKVESWREMRSGQLAKPEEIASERSIRLSGYPDNLRYLSKLSWEWLMDWKDDLRWVFDAVAFMLVGMLLYRLGWIQGQASSRTYLVAALVGYGLGVPLKTFEALRDWHLMMGVASPEFSMFWVPAITLQTARLLVTIGHAGLFLWCWKTFNLRLVPLQALGRMAFTGYLGQSILAAVIFSGFGLALWGRLSLAELWLTAAIIWAIEIAFAMAWLSRFSMGPFEWVWRTLTYGRAPALRLATAQRRLARAD
ncbi:MAG TPA: DUF418 domain-containing protein [Sphingomicrobium sp.]